jgi:hypothetical protein
MYGFRLGGQLVRIVRDTRRFRAYHETELGRDLEQQIRARLA